MRLLRLQLIVSICFFITSIAISQEYINFAGTYINLGMSKTEVMNVIDTDFYKIEKHSNSITVRNISNNKLVGSLNFNQSNHLTNIFKNWGSFSDAKEAFAILFSLLKKSDETSLFNEITLNEIVEPQFQSKNISIILDDREIYITSYEQNFSIQIAEVFE